MLKALLIRKNNTTLEVFGPLTAAQSKRFSDIDLVILMCDGNQIGLEENVEDVKLFEQCTSNSKLAESAKRSLKHIRTISYMFGSILSEEIKNFYFTDIEYNG